MPSLALRTSRSWTDVELEMMWSMDPLSWMATALPRYAIGRMLASSSGVKCTMIGKVSSAGGNTALAMLTTFLRPWPSQAMASDMNVRLMPRRDAG